MWGEEGCSFGPGRHAHKAGGRVRAVRTLAAETADAEDYKETVDPFYTYNKTDRTITLHLNSIALREVPTERELEPHHERDVFINRPYKKFQIAKRPYVKYETVTKTFSCDRRPDTGTNPITTTYTGYVLQNTNATIAKTLTPPLINYKDPSSNHEGSEQEYTKWRLPNQRELALIAMEWDNLKTYYTNDLTTTTIGKECNVVGYKAECTGSGWGAHLWHNWEKSDDTNNYLHCRTSFSNSKFFGDHQTDGKYFRPFGYLYAIDSGIITMSAGDGYGTAGYLGVRDVP